MKLYSCSMPLPPSVNQMFAGVGRRYKSPKYKSWCREAYFLLRDAPKLNVPVIVHYTVYFATKRPSDISNFLKAGEDMLVTRGIIPDDSHQWVVALSMKFGGYDKQNPRLEVEIHAA